MNSSVQVGCSFAGCYSDPPPAIVGGLVAASIALQPSNATVIPGQSASFSVIAAGSGPLSYQWYKNGIAITGATGDSYAISTTAADNGVVFTVRVANSVGMTVSEPAILYVGS
jgi:hypothetical protein